MADDNAVIQSDSGQQPASADLAAQSVADAAAKEVQLDAANAQSGVVATAETASSGWPEALEYADYLHTDCVLLVLGVWICAGIMLARLLLDRVVR